MKDILLHQVRLNQEHSVSFGEAISRLGVRCGRSIASLGSTFPKLDQYSAAVSSS